MCVCTENFAERRSFSVQHEESPKHSHHVEDDITQKGARGHRERLDQRHAACNHCGDKYTSACGGEGKSKIRANSFLVFQMTPVVCLFLKARPHLPNKAPTASPAVCGCENAAMALKMSGAPLPRARNVTPSAHAAVKENWLTTSLSL